MRQQIGMLVSCTFLVLSSVVLAKGKAMTPFQRAKANLWRELSARYKLGSTHVKVEPDADDISGYAEHKTADLYAFDATLPRETKQRVTGFASASGDVVLDEKGLGLLLRHARFLEPDPAVPPKGLAERVLFLGPAEMGKGHLLRERGPTAAPPRIERHPDGSASLVFFYESFEGVEGMSLHSTPAIYRAEVRVTKDYQAKLAVMILPEAPPTF